MMPSQKAGTDRPSTLTAASTKSGSELRRSAATTPIGMPTRIDTTSAVPASSSVFGSRWPMRKATGSLLRHRRPEVAVDARPATIARSAPAPADRGRADRLSASRCSGVTSMRISDDGPPGARLTSRNVIALTRKSTITPWTTRWTAMRSVRASGRGTRYFFIHHSCT